MAFERSPPQSNDNSTTPLVESAAGPAAKRQHRKVDSSPYRSRANSVSSFRHEDVGGYQDDAKDVDWSPVSERNDASSFTSRRRGSIASSATSEWEVDANSRLTDLKMGEPDDRLANITKLAQATTNPAVIDRHRSTFCHVWLGQAYTASTEPPCNVSRQALYACYDTVCQQHGIRPVNAASFGKAVKATFPTIKTRRLGVRGCSRYHYCGMRPVSEREQQLLDHYSNIDKHRVMASYRDRSDSSASSFSSSSFGPDDDDDADAEGELDPDFPALRHAASAPRLNSPHSTSFPKQEPTDELDSRRRHSITAHSFNSTSSHITPPLFRVPDFPTLTEALVIAPELSTSHVQSVWTDFERCCTALVNAAEGRRFDTLEQLIHRIYEQSTDDFEKKQIFEHPVFATTMLRGEAAVYNAVLASVGKLVGSMVPQPVFAALRYLVENMERIIVKAAEQLNAAVVGPKIELAARFAHLLGRQLGILQLAQALSTILSSPATCVQMSQSLAQIDIEHLRNHCALALDNGISTVIDRVFADCAAMLSERSQRQVMTIHDFVNWLDSTYDRVLATTKDGKSGARRLLVNTSFVCSQFLRDLTLRSDPTFGSFQIAVLFLQEFWSLRSMRTIALRVDAPEMVYKPARPAPLPLRPELMGYSGPSYLAVSPAQARFDHPSTTGTYPGVVSTVSPRTAQAFHDAASFTGEGGQSLTVPAMVSTTGLTPTPMALTFADRWRTAGEEDADMDTSDFITVFKTEEE